MIHIVDYGVGNIASLVNMFGHLGFDAVPTDDPAEIARADHLVLPGVGAFDHAMRELAARDLVVPLHDAAARRAHILGVCLGMQLLGRSSEEGTLPGLGLIDATTVRLPATGRDGQKLAVPNIGWHMLEKPRQSPLLDNSARPERFYFVHSYHLVCAEPNDVAGTILRGGEYVTVAVSRDTLHGVQFHPEKSHRHGMLLLEAFARL